MKSKKDNPGIHIPPPLFYITIFFISIVLQRYFPISKSFFEHSWIGIIATIVIVFGALFILPAFFEILKIKEYAYNRKAGQFSSDLRNIHHKPKSDVHRSPFILYRNSISKRKLVDIYTYSNSYLYNK